MKSSKAEHQTNSKKEENDMTVANAKKTAKDTLLSALSSAYYRIADNDDDYTEEEKELIFKYINQYGEAMAKRIGERYYTT